MEDNDLYVPGWHKNTEMSNIMVYVTGVHRNEGEDYVDKFSVTGYGVDQELVWGRRTWGKINLVSATAKEIIDMLRQEAIRRRYYKGCDIISLGDYNTRYETVSDISEWYYNPATNEMWTQPRGLKGRLVFKEGLWAGITSF